MEEVPEPKWYKGQKVCINGKVYELASVGKKYGHLGEHANHLKFDLTTGLVIQSYGSREQVWPSYETWRADNRKYKAWSLIRRQLQNTLGIPQGFDPDNLPQIQKLLGMPIEEPK